MKQVVARRHDSQREQLAKRLRERCELCGDGAQPHCRPTHIVSEEG